ncbi:hypothetical protein SAMN05421856_10432 [Chryseobacterium taichungense]|uniref:Branched-chain amino acid:cation transporter, LIVCS family n=1 Tax=Chryseobacterium taichungense TaxID=295069 RepID=A0A1H7Z3G8_9FLAO|nr:hypothetical protein [Chryseobacterium taichungense]SEM53142.1 hypothetical protein SAMN05421856_10432 [Chryseobacterium taichungense]
MITQKQKTTIIFAVPALLLAAAFFANLLMKDWNWSIFDFIVATVILFGTAFFVNLVVLSNKTFITKVLVSFVILLIVCLVWIELAVGIFGSPFAGN